MKIFTFPYAFGNKSIFKEMGDEMGCHTVIPIDYPGHGSRYTVSCCPSISGMAKDAYEQIKNDITVPYCLLGYSMGALVAFELCRIIEECQDIPPVRLFLLAADSPDYKRDCFEWTDRKLDDIRRILELHGNTPKEILENEKMLEVLFPIVQNDMIALDNYSIENHDNKKITSCPVTLVRGMQELTVEKSMDDWKKYIDSIIELIIVDGGHFFLFDDNVGKKKGMEIIKQKLYGL